MVNFAKNSLESYPKVCAFMQDALPNLPQQRPAVWDFFLTHSSLKPEAATAALSPTGTLPQIWFQDINKNGVFRYNEPHSIILNKQAAKEFEKTDDNTDAQEFMLAKTLHEMVHWALYPYERRNEEKGQEFEFDAFTVLLPRFWVPGEQPITRAMLRIPDNRPPGGAPVANPIASLDVTRDSPRGIRNRNPGNIRIGANWKGLAEPDQMTDFQREESSFCVFEEDTWGVRALARTLRTYQNKHGLKTVNQMIGRWAPPIENQTDAYVASVSKAIGVGANDPINIAEEDVAVPMMAAIIHHENGEQPYTPALLKEGYRLSA